MVGSRIFQIIFIMVLFAGFYCQSKIQNSTRITREIDSTFPFKHVKVILEDERGRPTSRLDIISLDQLKDIEVPLGTLLKHSDIYNFMEASDAWYKILAAFSCIHIIFLSFQLMYKTIITTFGKTPILQFSDDFADLIE